MNFANKLMSSAKEAAEKAKNFKGFDEMAEEDEYIHSEGLNVKSTATKGNDAQSQANSTQSPEPTWSLLDRPTPNTASNSRGRPVSRNASTISSASPASSLSPGRPGMAITPVQPVPPSTRNVTPYLSVVADALESEKRNKTNMYNSKSSFSGYDSDNEQSSHKHNTRRHHDTSSSSEHSSSDDSSSDDDDDVILTQIRNTKKIKHKPRHNNKHRKNHRSRKNPNRFLEELNSQLPPPVPGSSAATAEEFAQQQQHQHQQYALEIQSNQPPTTGRLTGFKSWMATSLGTKNQSNTTTTTTTAVNSIAAKATSFLKVGPLSRRDNPPTSQNNMQQQEQEFLIKSSTSLMSQEELDALAAMNSQSKTTSPFTLLQKHPREAFILFTMILALLVYFWTHQFEEDDVQ